MYRAWSAASGEACSNCSMALGTAVPALRHWRWMAAEICFSRLVTRYFPKSRYKSPPKIGSSNMGISQAILKLGLLSLLRIWTVATIDKRMQKR